MEMARTSPCLSEMATNRIRITTPPRSQEHQGKPPALARGKLAVIEIVELMEC